MEVSKLGKITIDEPFLKYYSLKQKYESRKRQICPICSKGPLEFDIKERVLVSVCINNPLCSGNMNISPTAGRSGALFIVPDGGHVFLKVLKPYIHN